MFAEARDAYCKYVMAGGRLLQTLLGQGCMPVAMQNQTRHEATCSTCLAHPAWNKHKAFSHMTFAALGTHNGKLSQISTPSMTSLQAKSQSTSRQGRNDRGEQESLTLIDKTTSLLPSIQLYLTYSISGIVMCKQTALQQIDNRAGSTTIYPLQANSTINAHVYLRLACLASDLTVISILISLVHIRGCLSIRCRQHLYSHSGSSMTKYEDMAEMSLAATAPESSQKMLYTGPDLGTLKAVLVFIVEPK